MKNERIETDIFVELHVPDFKLAINFYKKLGFEVVWVNLDEKYLVMKRGRSILNFYGGSEKVYNQSYFKAFPRNTKRGYAVELAIQVDNLENFYKKIKDKVKVVRPLEMRPWGRKDFRIEDPFGFYLRFSEPHDWVNDKKRISETKKWLEKL